MLSLSGNLHQRLAVKKTALAFLVLAIVAGGCKGHGRSARNATNTETIAPAAPEPAPNGTDAMTQTVDVEDSRSIAEGETDTAAVASDTATAVKKKSGAAASSRRTPGSKSRPPGRTQ